jgi:hypothetical protein
MIFGSIWIIYENHFSKTPFKNLDLECYVHTTSCTQTRLQSLPLGLEAPLASGTEAGEELCRPELTGGEPSGGAMSTNALRTPSRIDRCSCSAGWLTGASMPACMAHGGHTVPGHGKAVEVALELHGCEAKPARTKWRRGRQRSCSSVRSRALARGGRRGAGHAGLLPCRRWVAEGESSSLILVINNTKLLMPCVKWFKLGICKGARGRSRLGLNKLLPYIIYDRKHIGV